MAEPHRDSYDVVVIGAGIAGLTCGALLAKEGMSVLVVEQRPSPGGVCHSYQRDGYTFDVGPHLLSGCGEGWVVRNLLKAMGADNMVEFLPVNPLARAVFPDYSVEIPSNFEAFTDLLSQRFPQERPRLLMLFREMLQMYAEVDQLPHTFGIWQYLKVPVNQPIFMKYPGKTYAQMMDEFLLDERLKPVVAALWVYFGLPPSRISAVFWTIVMMSYFMGGGSYPKGGLGTLARALAQGLENCGGELLTSTMVERIAVSRGATHGVELRDVSQKWLPGGGINPQGHEGGPRYSVATKKVVSAADARRTFLELVGQEHLDGKYVRNLTRMEPSLSLVKLALGVDLDVAALGVSHHDTILFDTYDMDETFRRMTSQMPTAPCDITIPTLTDTSLAPRGKHCLYLWNYVPHDKVANWGQAAEGVAQDLIRGAEGLLPSLSHHIEVQNVMTPWTMEQYAMVSQGAPYGWAFTPGQMGFNRLQPRTPIKGLFLTGHWTTPGAGVAGAAMSGERTAQIIGAREGFSIWRKSA